MGNYTESAESVTSRTRILQYLERLRAAHSQLTLALPGIERAFSSTLIDVDREANKLVLDELIPFEGHERILADGSFSAFGHLEGTTTRFSGRIEEIDTEGKIASYTCPIPDQIGYTQERQYHRVYISTSPRPKVVLMIANRLTVGEAVNVSVGGAKIHLTSEPWFTPDTEIPSCIIELPYEQPLYCKAQIRNVQFEKQSGNWYAGIEFEAFTKKRKKAWESWIMNMQRRKRRAQIN